MANLITPLDALPEAYPVREAGQVEEHLILHLSDEHADETVEAHKVGGLEEYNFSVALCRAEQYVDTVIKWTQTTLKNFRFPVLHILSYGDHTSGEIHGAVSHSEYHNMFKNALSIGHMQALMIRDLAPYFPQVKVYCVSGNHGRRSKKKDYEGAHDNWDFLISQTAKMLTSDIRNVEFLIPDAYSINVDINGHGFCIEHGDGVPSWNSLPWYGLERKTRRLMALHNTVGKQVRYFVFGHFHSASTISDLNGETFINGAWVATSPYSYEAFSGYREPKQWIMGCHKDHGVTWRLPVLLKNPKREARGPSRYATLQF
ncbi:MAG: hypothetical protein HC888_07260 [Candidatus Competibacteraceae bacterium]|nr:hypothetical protein [Candidatus Competibacteraceae bacterium]